MASFLFLIKISKQIYVFSTKIHQISLKLHYINYCISIFYIFSHNCTTFFSNLLQLYRKNTKQKVHKFLHFHVGIFMHFHINIYILSFVMKIHPLLVRLICSSCYSDRDFTVCFLHIPSHDGHPCP